MKREREIDRDVKNEGNQKRERERKKKLLIEEGICASVRPPDMRPNLVPRSYMRLNSTYRPLRKSWNCLCAGVYGTARFASMKGAYSVGNERPRRRTKSRQERLLGLMRWSKKMPPVRRQESPQ